MTEVNFPAGSKFALTADGSRGMSLQAAVAITTAIIAKSDSIKPSDYATIRALFKNIAADAMSTLVPKVAKEENSPPAS
ncbi:hypothetical protein LJ725_22145 [Reyranella aquatilis]|uniref:Uncharacterized protein n=1 Tax=Reyranella aquatilis TaxID=2035356 RepID=A0ABS8L1L3_9HYPH|nr:hypothetical protein [Reyranella aquatilis]MCC8431686.1 hypothetical protein [Reyranella aquatilis]